MWNILKQIINPSTKMVWKFWSDTETNDCNVLMYKVNMELKLFTAAGIPEILTIFEFLFQL